jgi:hypothetical protein
MGCKARKRNKLQTMGKIQKTSNWKYVNIVQNRRVLHPAYIKSKSLLLGEKERF